jgi:hypothetical protein
MTSGVVCKSSEISVAILRREVEEKVAPSVTQLSTKTMAHLRQSGRPVFMPDAAVWHFSKAIGSGTSLLNGVDGAVDLAYILSVLVYEEVIAAARSI